MASVEHSTKYEVSKRPLQILVVDDNLPLLQFLELLLESNGFQPTSAASPLQAALLAQTHRYDALITDLRMPHLNGHQLLKEIRQHRFNRHMPVLFISGQSTSEFPELSQLELARYLRKPFSGNDLIKTLESLLENRSRVRRAELLRHVGVRADDTDDYANDQMAASTNQTIPSPGI